MEETEIEIYFILKRKYDIVKYQLYKIITGQGQQIDDNNDENYKDALSNINEETKKVNSLRNTKISIGNLMRIVKGQKY
jgi:hypothetical protein